MLPILVLLALPIILIFYFQKLKPKPAQNLLPPGPPGLPFIGNLHQFDAKYPHKCLNNLSKQYGPLMSMKLGSRPVLVISSAHVVKEIMKSHDIVFSGRPTRVAMQRLSYNGLDIGFSLYNDLWREMRKVFNLHLFSPKQVQFFRPVREDEVSRMINKISRDASLSRITNLSEMMNTMTSNTIFRVALGKSTVDERFASRFYDLFHDVQGVLAAFCVEDYFPLLGWIDEISGMRKRLEKIFRDLDSFYDELIEEHLDKNRPKSMEGDILDNVLGLMRDGSIPLTVDHVKGVIMTILLGGTDAIAAVTGPEFWKDADEFVPERFLNSEIDVRGQDPEVIPFGIGRRGCPGMLMGMATVELVLANFLNAFDWELPTGMKEEDLDFEVMPGIIMHKKNALSLVAKPVYG
ncbi:UNVERIFIED_CONTAM: cytochrome [Sesamum latifolium]|uniref:Cytochrome n=1 Tax=Sesamum latifolium TaxID=2727402 RepID=A0AAW2V0C8_9LAMI